MSLPSSTPPLLREAAALRAANERLTQQLAECTAALRRSEAHFRRLTEDGSDLLMIVGLDLAIRYVSPSAERLLGYRSEELVGCTPDDLLHPDDGCGLRDVLRAHAADDEHVVRAIWRIRHRDGGWRVFEALARGVSADAGEGGFVINARDVTERRQVEAAMRESAEQFRRMIENGSDLLLISRVDGRLTYASPSVERVLGWTPSEMIASEPRALLHADDLAHVMASMRAAGESPGVILHVDFRVRHRDGGWRRFEALARTLAPDSSDAGIVCNARDVTEQRAAEQALHRREEHFRRLIENGSDLLMISAPDGALTYVSPSAQRLLGYTPEEMLAKSPADLVHPDDLPALAENMRRVLDAPGTVGEMTWRIRHRDGGWRLIEALGRTIDPASAAEGIVVNGRDVTEQRAAERALQESEAKYRSVVDAAQDMITVIDARGVIAFQSPSAERILGFAPEEMVGRAILDFLHPDDVSMGVQRMGKVMTHPGVVEIVQYRNRCKDGSYRYVESTGRTILPDSAAAGAVGIVRDITARIEAEAALRQAKADAEQAHAEAERAAARDRLLADAGRVLGASLDTATALGQLAGLLVPAFADGYTVDLARDEGEYERVARAGDAPGHALSAALHWASVVRVPLGAAAAPSGWLTLGRGATRPPFDVAEWALADEMSRRIALAVENARLFRDVREAVTAREQVLAVVAHDLRSPLTAARFDLEMLCLEPEHPVGAGDARAMERVSRAMARMDGLIEDLLDAARLARGPLALERHPQAMDPLLGEAVVALRPLVEGRGLRFDARGPDVATVLTVDARRVQQALANLVGNAAKFAETCVTLTWSVTASELRVAVHDDGQGIPAEHLQHVFGAFWQARHADRRGLGLGLSIALAIAEAHGGRLWVESEVGRGSTFVLALPVPDEAAAD